MADLMTDGIIKDSAMRAIRRLCTSAEGRSAVTGEKLSLAILPSQIAVRATFVARSTANSEMASVRALLVGIAKGTTDENRERLIREHDWLRGVVVTDASEAIRLAGMSPSDYASHVSVVLRSCRAGVRGKSLDGLSDDELIRQISGVRRENPVGVKNKGNRSFGWSDYLTIMMDLSDSPPEEAVSRFVSSGEFSAGVARVAISALYMTGIRPVELFGLNMYVPRTDVMFTDEKRELVKRSPLTAIHDGVMTTIESAARSSGMSRGLTAVTAERTTGAPCVFSVMSAKQQNANKDLAFPVRFLMLSGIRAQDANLLGWAAELRRCQDADSAKNRLTGQTIAILRSICAANPEMRQDVTLYTFRHSFATRARLRYPENECSALTGHTAVRTFRGYGERKPLRSGGGWMPQPDPERAEFISQIWNGASLEAAAAEKAFAPAKETEAVAAPRKEKPLVTQNKPTIRLEPL